MKTQMMFLTRDPVKAEAEAEVQTMPNSCFAVILCHVYILFLCL